MKNLNIAQLALNTKTMTFDFPGYEGVKITLTHLTKPVQVRLREDSMVATVDKESGMPYNELDQELYLKNYAQKAVNGWEGLTWGHVADLMLLDEEQIEDKDALVEFNQENVVSMIKYSKVFDNWVTQTTAKLDNFRS